MLAFTPCSSGAVSWTCFSFWPPGQRSLERVCWGLPNAISSDNVLPHYSSLNLCPISTHLPSRPSSSYSYVKAVHSFSFPPLRNFLTPSATLSFPFFSPNRVLPPFPSETDSQKPADTNERLVARASIFDNNRERRVIYPPSPSVPLTRSSRTQTFHRQIHRPYDGKREYAPCALHWHRPLCMFLSPLPSLRQMSDHNANTS